MLRISTSDREAGMPGPDRAGYDPTYPFTLHTERVLADIDKERHAVRLAKARLRALWAELEKHHP